MRKNRKHCGFSLTEVLLAVGTLSIGMIFVAGVFPVGIYFATTATERTIAAVVADEAFAKVRIFGLVDFGSGAWPPDPTAACVDYRNVSAAPLADNDFAYPSTDAIDIAEKKYYWSALCRRAGLSDVQLTVFVCRKVGAGSTYWTRDLGILNPAGSSYPVPVSVSVSAFGTRELTIQNAEEKIFINDGYTIVDNETGRIYRVLERDVARPNTIILDRPWQGGTSVWVVPPPAGGGRYPCIAVYQKVIGF